jgi:hypothetical protein
MSEGSLRRGLGWLALVACGAPQSPAAPAPASSPPPVASARPDASPAEPTVAEEALPDVGPLPDYAPPKPPPVEKPPLRAGAIGGAKPRVDPATCSKVGIFLELPATSRTRCQEAANCTFSVPVRVVNCTDDEILPNAIVLKSDGPMAAILRGAPELAEELHFLNGGATNVRIPFQGAPAIPRKSAATGLAVEVRAGTRWEVEMFAENKQAPGMMSFARGSTEVVDQQLAEVTARARAARTARVADCKKQGGSLEIVGGIMASEQCVFPFGDKGKVCHDKTHCRGECLFTGAVPLENGKVRLDGRCSRLETTFGCHRRIGHTPGASGVVSAKDVPHSLCVD